MKDKLYKYLKSKGGTASSVAIVGQLLNIRGARRNVAESIIQGWVKDDDLFMSDGLGNWFINPEKAAEGRPLKDVVFNLVEIWGDAKTPERSSRLQIGLCRIQNQQILEMQIVQSYRGERPPSTTDLETYEPLPGAMADFIPKLDAGVLTGFDLPPVRKFINAAASLYLGIQMEIWALSLKELSRRLFPGHKIQAPADLAKELQLGFLDTDDLNLYLDQMAQLFFAILEKLQQSGISDLEGLLAFQLPKRKQVDFTQLSFDKEFLAQLPEAPGVYIMKNREGQVVYVGKARNLRTRVGSYFYAQEVLDDKLAEIWDQIYDLKITRLGSELEACLQEQKLIGKYKPAINVQMQLQMQTESGARVPENIIIILPAKKASMLNLFCVNERGKSAILLVSRRRAISKTAQKRLQTLFFSARSHKPTKREKTQTEIIMRWFRPNRDRVNWLDLHQTAGPEDCIRLLEQYKSRAGPGERVVYR